jgi:hypothetical protein
MLKRYGVLSSKDEDVILTRDTPLHWRAHADGKYAARAPDDGGLDSLIIPPPPPSAAAAGAAINERAARERRRRQTAWLEREGWADTGEHPIPAGGVNLLDANRRSGGLVGEDLADVEATIGFAPLVPPWYFGAPSDDRVRAIEAASKRAAAVAASAARQATRDREMVRTLSEGVVDRDATLDVGRSASSAGTLVASVGSREANRAPAVEAVVDVHMGWSAESASVAPSPQPSLSGPPSPVRSPSSPSSRARAAAQLPRPPSAMTGSFKLRVLREKASEEEEEEEEERRRDVRARATSSGSRGRHGTAHSRSDSAHVIASEADLDRELGF